MEVVLITGGAGFIGSHFARYLLQKYPNYQVTILDKLTYAGNRTNLADIEENGMLAKRYRFIHGDICNHRTVAQAMEGCKYVVHFAAESHVDRSINSPDQFIMTNTYGTYTLLEQAHKQNICRFLQVSTDEVYGSRLEGVAEEASSLIPSNPYSASKASGDLLAYAYFVTYGLPVVITRGSNNFGPFQYPEKLIPLFVINALMNQPLPIYGDGLQVRDWMYVLDYCRGIDIALHTGHIGEAYNIGGCNEWANLAIAHFILDILSKPYSLIKHIPDRLGHDRRYALSTAKVRQLGWQPEYAFETALEQTIMWYCKYENWWKSL